METNRVQDRTDTEIKLTNIQSNLTRKHNKLAENITRSLDNIKSNLNINNAAILESSHRLSDIESRTMAHEQELTETYVEIRMVSTRIDNLNTVVVAPEEAVKEDRERIDI